MSLTSRGLRISPIGGIAETGFVRSAMSAFAIRRSAGGVPARDDDLGGRLLAQRPVHALTVLQGDPDGAVAGRDAGARLEQRLEDLVARQARGDSGQVWPDIRAGTAHGVASGALRPRGSRRTLPARASRCRPASSASRNATDEIGADFDF